MKVEFKILRELAFLLMNIFFISFMFDFMNEKNSGMVLLGIIGLAVVFILDCMYLRRVLIPMAKNIFTKLENYHLK
jgi:uncharacterized membrane protein (DUF485 family)